MTRNRRGARYAADSSGSATAGVIKQKPFGAKNRERLLQLYFEDKGRPKVEGAWEHVYRLLLWVDQTIGLAHCYESDKSQPGRPWYARSLAFHAWLSDALKVDPAALGEDIDWMFRTAVSDLAEIVLGQQKARGRVAERQREVYRANAMPLPGEDPELTQIIRDVLGEHLDDDVPDELWRELIQKIRQYLGLENKRKNLVGEGFEDVLAALLVRVPGGEKLEVVTRRLLHDIPGFNRARAGDKPNKVDVGVIDRASGMRTLVTAKWSVRADREKQFSSDFADYVAAESDRRAFNYVLVTNEFDPARLLRACEALAANAPMFAHVVHISTDGLRVAYGASPDESARRVVELIDSGRLLGLGAWFAKLVTA
jgi:hypothetical protein